MTVGERDGNAAIRQATTLLLQRSRPRDFIAEKHHWRASPDVRVAIMCLVPEPLAVQVREDGAYLYGARLMVDDQAPEWTLELVGSPS